MPRLKTTAPMCHTASLGLKIFLLGELYQVFSLYHCIRCVSHLLIKAFFYFPEHLLTLSLFCSESQLVTIQGLLLKLPVHNPPSRWWKRLWKSLPLYGGSMGLSPGNRVHRLSVMKSAMGQSSCLATNSQSDLGQLLLLYAPNFFTCKTRGPSWTVLYFWQSGQVKAALHSFEKVLEPGSKAFPQR